MEEKKVRLYIDVDGVINASQGDFVWQHTNSEGECDPNGDGFRYLITWVPAMIYALKTLDVEVVWLTTWCMAAPREIGGLTGFGQEARVLLPLHGREVTFPSINWKRASLVADQKADPSLFIWVDDELGLSEEGLKLALPDTPRLLLQPDAKTGITPNDVERMKEFIKSNSSHDLDEPEVLDPEPGPVDLVPSAHYPTPRPQ